MGVGDITKVRLEGVRGTKVISVTRYWETTQSIGPKDTEYEALRDSLEEVYFFKTVDDDILDFCHSTITWYTWRFRDVTDDTVGIDYSVFGGGQQGTLTGDPLDIRTSMYGQRKSVKIGRRYQGFNYWPFGDESKISDGYWDWTFRGNVIDWLQLGQEISVIPFNHQFKEVNYSKKYATKEDVSDYNIANSQAYLKKRR